MVTEGNFYSIQARDDKGGAFVQYVNIIGQGSAPFHVTRFKLAKLRKIADVREEQ